MDSHLEERVHRTHTEEVLELTAARDANSITNEVSAQLLHHCLGLDSARARRRNLVGLTQAATSRRHPGPSGVPVGWSVYSLQAAKWSSVGWFSCRSWPRRLMS